MTFTVCRSCRASIKWLTTAAGKKMPVDAGTARADDDTFDARRHKSHFATCPNAARHRNQTRKEN